MDGMPSARWWKDFYERERSKMDLDALLDAAPRIPFPERGALVFPHTRLAASGGQVASVALSAARTGRSVLAVGVLHGVQEGLRGVHTEEGLAAEEFSLDGFRALYERACRREGVPPRLTTRYPLRAGDRPEDLPELDDLARLARESVVVGTGDLVHHGVAYGTAEAFDGRIEETRRFARASIEEQLAALAGADFPRFARLCTEHRSDFRDVGPVLALLFPGARWTLEDLVLVDYSEALASRRPSWVAAGLIRVAPSGF